MVLITKNLKKSIALPLAFASALTVGGCGKTDQAISSDASVDASVMELLAENSDMHPAEAFFKQKVHRMLYFACVRCHVDKNRLGMDGDPDHDYELVRDEISPGNPENSKLYFWISSPDTKHPGGQVFKEGSEKLRLIREWIELEGK